MDQLDSGTRLEGPSSIDKIVERLTSCENGLTEVIRIVGELNHKVDTLLAGSAATYAQGFGDGLARGDIVSGGSRPAFIPPPYQFPFNATTSNQGLVYNGPGLNSEFERSGMYTVTA